MSWSLLLQADGVIAWHPSRDAAVAQCACADPRPAGGTEVPRCCIQSDKSFRRTRQALLNCWCSPQLLQGPLGRTKLTTAATLADRESSVLSGAKPLQKAPGQHIGLFACCFRAFVAHQCRDVSRSWQPQAKMAKPGSEFTY